MTDEKETIEPGSKKEEVLKGPDLSTLTPEEIKELEYRNNPIYDYIKICT